MSNVKLKNVDRFVDRHGKPRHYFRQGRGARVRLPGEPGSPEYTQAYEQAVVDVTARAQSQSEAACMGLPSSLAASGPGHG